MSKVLRISQGGYKIITEPGSEIRLDTGEAGQVLITGDLIVQGGATKIEVEDLQIEDKIIIINKFPDGSTQATYPGIHPAGGEEAGIEIKRGQAPNSTATPHVRFVYDDSQNYISPFTGTLNKGIFVFKDVNQKLLGIATNYISSGASDLHFNPGLTGKLQIKVSNFADNPYSERIGENDDIPNVKFIKEYVRAEAGQAIIEKYSRFYTDEDDNFFDTRTGSRAEDVIAGDLNTGVFFTVALGNPGPNGTLGINRKVYEVGAFNRNGLFIGDSTPQGTTDAHLKLYVENPDDPLDPKYAYIETDNGPLVLNPETGLIKIKNKVEIENLLPGELNPTPVPDTNTVWSRADQGAGGTGIYFANTTTQGEICSAAKALVYGLIF